MQTQNYVKNCGIMTQNDAPLIVIPARMAASRLPGKPLADIAGKPMIQHVWERACEANIGPVYVATDHADIAAVIESAGGHAVLTRSDHPSGSDRVFEAVQTIDPEGRFDIILNLQGDLPELGPSLPALLAQALVQSGGDLATLVTPATSAEAALPQIVKAVVSWEQTVSADFDPEVPVGRAHYFSRAAIPTGVTSFWHHIGVYGWRRTALARFVGLPPSPLERAERLEQLRALEAGMHIAVAKVDSAPGGVDTEAELAAARKRLAAL